ncbi:hypothetical protein ABB37_04032 [Leptomonas pyrrhocoris]|uniref:Uncharacterized protein n=1 Tax=Leptomonas pyrrhocoris TaxID=157538 RepID=A0A0N0DWG4_LEPPY|nr:hypothetical protein ABB37_04032 [Leptomonas pyrrhocoris]KPA81742.1 hypothetical protein ABB37_04032 [Leptomonas pyrrhocoris]|eukprot:XP_015660181.1 hypothetical protein ABB37_04032 [Leptomonas pyrrhocoris]
MSDAPPPHVEGDATQRFYHKQRTCGEPTVHAALASCSPHDSLSASAPFAQDAALDSLEAFLNSREEDALELLATFTQLTEQDKVKALAQLEGEVPSEDGGNKSDPSGASNTPARKPAASYAEVRRRLQERERERQRAEQQQQQQRGKETSVRYVDASNGVSYADTVFTHCAGNPGCVEAEEDVLVTVELGEGTHTGNLVAFFDSGVTDVSTSFDNFFTETAAVVAPAACGGAVHSTGTPTFSPCTSSRIVPTASCAPLTLDEILAVDCEGERADSLPKITASKAFAHRAAEAPQAEIGTEAVDEGHDNGRGASASTSSSSSSSLSDVSSVSLPGLHDSDDTHVEGVRTQHIAEKTKAEALRFELAADLHEVIAEHDDCVQPFALDPLFDYDADIFGEAFRTERAWRQ